MPVSASGAAFVRELVYRRAAIVLEESKLYLIEARLEPVAIEAGFKSIDELVNAAKNGAPSLQTKVIEALTTNETSFFRDLAPFECLRQTLLPGLLAARAGTRELTIWCAACSTGQEPYSIAMLISEHFPDLVNWPVRILATDLAEPQLSKARAGRYRQLEINRGLPAKLLIKYFDQVGTEWVVKPSVRRLIEFSQLNLIDAWTMTPKPAIVFIRNVLIYFDHGTKKSILEHIGRVIAPGGALFLGAAETTLNVDDSWERVPFDKSAYYRARM